MEQGHAANDYSSGFSDFCYVLQSTGYPVGPTRAEQKGWFYLTGGHESKTASEKEGRGFESLWRQGFASSQNLL